MCDRCSKLTIWEWSLKLKVSRIRSSGSSPLDYEHELKVTTSTIQYSQGPWYSTVQVQCIIIMSSIPLKHTYKERASEASSLLVYIYISGQIHAFLRYVYNLASLEPGTPPPTQ